MPTLPEMTGSSPAMTETHQPPRTATHTYRCPHMSMVRALGIIPADPAFDVPAAPYRHGGTTPAMGGSPPPWVNAPWVNGRGAWYYTGTALEFAPIAERAQLVPDGRARVRVQNPLGKQEVFRLGEILREGKATGQARPKLVRNQAIKEQTEHALRTRIVRSIRQLQGTAGGIVIVELQLRRSRLNLPRRWRPFRVGPQLGRCGPQPDDVKRRVVVDEVCRDKLVGCQQDVRPPFRRRGFQHRQHVVALSVDLRQAPPHPGTAAVMAEADKDRHEVDRRGQLRPDGLDIAGKPSARIDHDERHMVG